VRPHAILIEKNPHLRAQLAETMRRLGIVLVASYDAVPQRMGEEVASSGAGLVIFSLKQAHAGHWRLVHEMQALPDPPVMMALSSLDIPAIRQSALAQGVSFVFDPLLEIDAFLLALREVAAVGRQMAS
jgi:DNA-binding response OmpR family regulator